MRYARPACRSLCLVAHLCDFPDKFNAVGGRPAGNGRYHEGDLCEQGKDMLEQPSNGSGHAGGRIS